MHYSLNSKDKCKFNIKYHKYVVSLLLGGQRSGYVDGEAFFVVMEHKHLQGV